jgi:predicted O-linked N-acetylglucosamine transferase (SPINDLY family)
MSDTPLLTALQKITAGTLDLGELVGLANGLCGQGDVLGAEQLYRVWISFNPDHPQLYAAYYNCSTLPLGPERAPAAVEALEKVVALSPDFIPAYINLGGLYERAGDSDRAINLWKTAVDRLAAVDGSAVSHKLTALKQICRVLIDHQASATAEAYLRQCLSLDPKQRDAVEQYIGVRLSQCRWPVIAPWDGVDRKTLMESFSPLSMAVFTDDPLLQLATAARYVEVTIGGGNPQAATDRRHAAIDLSSRRLRVGYVSSDFRDHAIGYLLSELLEVHDKAKVELFAYYCGPPASDATNARNRAAVEHWTDLNGLTDDAAAQAIAADGIDVLVDVNGHTRFSRTAVFARRPAPVIVNWLGYPGSMGTPWHQYIIADAQIIPPGSEIYYAEKVVRLPCYQPNDRKRVIAERPSRADAGLPDDAFVFCCFNGAQKIGRFTLLRWLEALKRTPNSVLWLLTSDDATNDRLADFAEAEGVARQRLVFAPKQANAHHLARYPLADLFLDTAPYGAHTTASDALFMGVPVLTLPGRSFASRVCASLVHAAGLGDLICATPDEYVSRAAALGADPDAVRAYKVRLETNRATCDLFNMEKLAGCLEDLYFQMCDDHQQGRSPQPDLDNLDVYLQVGIQDDPEAVEMLTIDDYRGFYKDKLLRRHLDRPIRPDRRLWSQADADEADAPPRPPEAPPQKAPRRAVSETVDA